MSWDTKTSHFRAFISWHAYCDKFIDECIYSRLTKLDIRGNK